MRLQHPIFQGPLSPDLELEPTPNSSYPGSVWRVHSGKFPEIDVGMVSDGYGFEDSPDCERISGGINSKGPQAVAIGRQANVLLWGFYGAPDRLTDSAKRVFLNTIVYMTRFEGDQPLFQGERASRESIFRTIEGIDILDRLDEAQRTNYEDYLRRRFPDYLMDEFGLDTKALTEYYKENLEYLYQGPEGPMEVDEDLETLELSARSDEFLSTLLSMLDEDPKDALAIRLVNRYVGPPMANDLTKLRAWVNENRDYLYFTDRGGYRWRIDHNAKRRATAKASAAEEVGAR